MRAGLLLASALWPITCWAGPPFFTDDPVPVDLGHWEINNYVSGTLAKGAFAGVAPGVDANYGAAANLQLHLLVPMALVQSNGASAQWGPGDVEIGAKYRFIPADEKDWWPQVAFYPFLDFPTGNADRGLGTGSTHLFLPIWLQKDFGKWSTYGGAGYWINPGPGNRNFWYAGWVLQYQLTEALALGGEIYHQTGFLDRRTGQRRLSSRQQGCDRVELRRRLRHQQHLPCVVFIRPRPGKCLGQQPVLILPGAARDILMRQPARSG